MKLGVTEEEEYQPKYEDTQRIKEIKDKVNELQTMDKAEESTK